MKSVDTKVYKITETIREKANLADELYQNKASKVHEALSDTIYLSQINSLRRIVADALKAAEELYLTYEALVRTLDSKCKSIIDEGASADAVKEVCDLIEYLNAESSSIDCNFTLSIEMIDMGDLGGMSFIASVEAQAIEALWKSNYSTMPEVIEAEKQSKIIENKEKDELKKALKEVEKKKKENAELAKEIELKNQKAKEYMDSIIQECKQCISDYKNRLEEELEAQISQLEKSKETETLEIKKKISKKQDELSNMGLFNFSQKKILKDEIRNLSIALEKLNTSNIVSQKNNYFRELIDGTLKDYKKTIDEYLSKRFPKTDDEKSSTVELEPADIILQVMDSADSLMTISDIKLADYRIPDSNQKVSAFVRQLVVEGLLMRKEIKECAYFKITPKGRLKIAEKTDPLPVEKYRENPEYANTPIPESPSVMTIFKQT
ncbi:MAG: hypothetical protein IKL05_03540 [Clostridia bacterium]|nr:hypothetical protein [Clostridia bacterium]